MGRPCDWSCRDHPPYPPFARGGKGRNEIGMKAQLVQDQLFTSPGWVSDTFGQDDSMATPLGGALAAIGATPKAQPGHDPENLVAAVLTAVPALVIAGVVLLAGGRHLPREMALMIAKLRAAPSRVAARPGTARP